MTNEKERDRIIDALVEEGITVRGYVEDHDAIVIRGGEYRDGKMTEYSAEFMSPASFAKACCEAYEAFGRMGSELNSILVPPNMMRALEYLDLPTPVAFEPYLQSGRTWRSHSHFSVSIRARLYPAKLARKRKAARVARKITKRNRQ